MITSYIKCGLSAAFFLLHGLACATVQMSHFPPNPGVMPGGGWQWSTSPNAPGSTFANPTGPRTWINGVYGGVPKISASQLVTISGRAGPLAVNVTQRVLLGDAAAAVGRCLLGGGAVCAAGTAAALLYATYRINLPSSVPGSVVSGNLLSYDPGSTATESGTIYTVVGATNTGLTCTGATVSGSPRASAEACFKQLLVFPNDQALAPLACMNTACNVMQSTFQMRALNPNTGLYYNAGQGYAVINMTASKAQVCSASIDPLDPAYNVPAGSTVGLDGRCPTARYNHVGISPSDAGLKLAANPSLSAADLQKPLSDSIDFGGQSVPAEVTSSGPESQVGSPTSSTTTNPSGSTTTTSTPTFNYSYPGDKVLVSTSTTTNTCVGASSCSSANSTSTTVTQSQPADNTEQKDPCSSNPSRAGCAEMGTAPPSSDIVKKDINVSYSAASGWGAGDSACPAPRVVTLMRQSITIDNTILCKFMSGIRFAVIGMFGIAAAALFIGGLKT
jgi:hypothetical protein